MKKTVIILSDLHFPFHCHETLKWAFQIIKKESPDCVVQGGDLMDFTSASRFPKTPGAISMEEEIKEGRRLAEFMWDKIKQLVPRATLYQLLGNHCIRPKKLILDKCPDLYPFVAKTWEDLFKFKGVNTIMDEKEELIIDNVVYEHGYFMKPGQHLKDNMKSTVYNHTHRPWIHYEQIRNELLWEMNCGHMANPQSPALSYTRKRWVRWVKGIGLVKDGFPQFLPYPG